jgi:hypothetical protein
MSNTIETPISMLEFMRILAKTKREFLIHSVTERENSFLVVLIYANGDSSRYYSVIK